MHEPFSRLALGIEQGGEMKQRTKEILELAQLIQNLIDTIKQHDCVTCRAYADKARETLNHYKVKYSLPIEIH